MPIFMDRHDVSKDVTAENVAHLHQEDLKIQDQFGCRGLTYWFDEERKTAFCLVEAPHARNIKKMHDMAHGDVPHQIIEVEATIVESFLGRIEDPVNAKNTGLNIINDPAFRTLMVVQFRGNQPHSISREPDQKTGEAIEAMISGHQGRLVKQKPGYFLVSFESVTDAIKSAVRIRKEMVSRFTGQDPPFPPVKIGINAGVPVTKKNSLFEDTVKLAERMCTLSLSDIVVSQEVKELYQSAHQHRFVSDPHITSLRPDDEKFITMLYDYTESVYQNSELRVQDFCSFLGLSKSRLYRKLLDLLGTSPNTFLKTYRLNRASELLQADQGTVSEIAFDTGFTSPSYFTKCFIRQFNQRPSDVAAH